MKPEEALQVAIVRLLTLNGFWPVHVPNEGERSPYGHQLQVAMGLVPGFTDLLVFAPRGTNGGLIGVLEAKRPPRRKKRGGWCKGVEETAKQAAVHEELRARGVPVRVVNSIEQVIAAMDEFGWPLNARVMA